MLLWGLIIPYSVLLCEYIGRGSYEMCRQADKQVTGTQTEIQIEGTERTNSSFRSDRITIF